jgi:hypothetical protein
VTDLTLSDDGDDDEEEEVVLVREVVDIDHFCKYFQRQLMEPGVDSCGRSQSTSLPSVSVKIESQYPVPRSVRIKIESSDGPMQIHEPTADADASAAESLDESPPIDISASCPVLSADLIRVLSPVELDIGGHRYQASVQTLRHVSGNVFDAYFDGKHALDLNADGSIFVDRDGEHFGHVLEYMRDGIVAVAEAGAHPSVSLLRALKREFGFYCIELSTEGPAEPEKPELAFIIGGFGMHGAKDDVQRYDPTTDEWSMAAALTTSRSIFGTCAVAGEIYVTGGHRGGEPLSSTEKYSPTSDTWSAGVPLPYPRNNHAAISVGATIYVVGGEVGDDKTRWQDFSVSASVLKWKTSESTWIEVAPMPEVRSRFAACVVGTDIYVFGGIDDNREEQASVFKYDTKANTWDVLGPMQVAPYGSSVSVIDGLIYMTGAGEHGHDFLRFEPTTSVWSTLASTLCRQSYNANFVLGGSLYAAGRTTTERYDAVTNTWTAVANMLEDRSFFGAVAIGPIENAEEQDLFDSLIAKAVRERQ